MQYKPCRVPQKALDYSVMIIKQNIKNEGEAMKNYNVYQNNNGTWTVVLPYKTTCWATKEAAVKNAKAMELKLEGGK